MAEKPEIVEGSQIEREETVKIKEAIKAIKDLIGFIEEEIGEELEELEFRDERDEINQVLLKTSGVDFEGTKKEFTTEEFLHRINLILRIINPGNNSKEKIVEAVDEALELLKSRRTISIFDGETGILKEIAAVAEAIEDMEKDELPFPVYSLNGASIIKTMLENLQSKIGYFLL